MKPSEQGLFFRAGQNESKQWYATIKTYKIISISAQYQYFCMNPSEQGSFLLASQNESKQWYATHFDRLGKTSPVLKVSCRNIDIMLRYLFISIFLHETFRTRLFFSEPIEISPKSGMLRSKLTKT